MTEHEPSPSLPAVMALAYLGDAEHTRHVRHRLVARGISASGELHSLSLSYVTAERQAEVMHRIEPILTDEERDVFRRARNHSHLNRPRHASVMEYRYATGFEAVLGFLSYTGRRERLGELLDIAVQISEEKEKQM